MKTDEGLLLQIQKLENENKKLKKQNKELKILVKKLQYEYDTSRGLWCIDQNPKNVSIKWIRQNSYQLT